MWLVYILTDKILKLVTISVRQEICNAVGREVLTVVYHWHKALGERRAERYRSVTFGEG